MYNNSSDDDDDYDCSITGALDAVVTVLDLVWTCRGLGRHGKICWWYEIVRANFEFLIPIEKIGLNIIKISTVTRKNVSCDIAFYEL